MDKICVVDFDGTICEFAFPEMGEPKKGVKEALTKIREMGYEIHIFSCRTNVELFKHPIDRQEQVREMKKYMDKFEIPYDQILNKDKPLGHIYIDDRAIGFRDDWEKAVEEMREL